MDLHWLSKSPHEIYAVLNDAEATIYMYGTEMGDYFEWEVRKPGCEVVRGRHTDLATALHVATLVVLDANGEVPLYEIYVEADQ